MSSFKSKMRFGLKCCVNTGFEVYMFSEWHDRYVLSSPIALSGFYEITSLNQILEIVAIKCFQSVSVADYNDISVGATKGFDIAPSIKKAARIVSLHRILMSVPGECPPRGSQNYFSSGVMEKHIRGLRESKCR